ncbi:Gfo/Idh/MocA family oxidoreductase [Paenibacillus sp. J5C_2022]|uniref:Gfo/Idh/MocA family protein n=1 Tax=Paenibacillus sp. J5C2022 TaxID=2977129 RepID=UPI0021CE8B35|nr:Gfo/Idh/MocA family oxidoreductase [Paenibacillus sp. J5C2022]MCU6712166.1 Gfo/Idh/MocA family oxidoreductase [Paenibacillus sp. J5C2022]
MTLSNSAENKGKVFRTGIIGCGSLGRTHAKCIEQLEGMELVAYCDVYQESARKLLEEFGGQYATCDLDRFFNDPDIDVIYITTMHDTHADFCVRALESGKHVLVEKPLAMSVEDCVRIGEAVKKTGMTLFTAFKMRYYELLWKAKELIPSPILVTMQMMDDRWGDGIWPNDPVKGGGNVISQGCHSTDILRFVAGGDPVEVYAAGGNYYQPTGVVDNLTAVYRFDSGTGGNLVQGDCGCPPLTSKFFMQVFAEGKSITLSDRLTTLTYREAGAEPQVFHGSESGFLEENKAFLRCLQEGKPASIDHVDGLYATLMVLQAIASLKSGRPEPIKAIVERSLSLQKEGV